MGDGTIELSVVGTPAKFKFSTPSAGSDGSKGTLTKSVLLDGLWSVTVTEVFGPSYPTQIAVNVFAFDIDYPTQGCTGTLPLCSFVGYLYDFPETILTGLFVDVAAIELLVHGTSA